jgi:hypothetical protein
MGLLSKFEKETGGCFVPLLIVGPEEDQISPEVGS